MLDFFEKKFFYFFIILQPVLDLITSVMSRNMNISLTIGVIARSIFMICMFVYAIFIYRPSNKVYKYSRLILISIAIYILIFLVNTILNKPTSYIVTELKGIIKLFYFPIVLTGLFIQNEKNNINISNEFLMKVLLIYTGSIFISSITGTYYRSYNEYIYGKGTIGWFFAANEIGSIIAILAPFTVINIIKNKLNIINVISIILCILSSLYIGTKVPFIGFIGVLVILFIYLIATFLYIKISKKSISIFLYKRILGTIISISLLFGVLFYKSPIYENIVFNYGHIIHKVTNYIYNKEDKQNQKESNSNENIDENKEINNANEESIDLEINMHVNQNDMVASLLSNRTVFANEVKNIFNRENIMDKLFGIGSVVLIRENVYTDKTIEMDHLDIFYRHGIIGTVLYFAQLIIIFTLIIRNIIRKNEYLLDLDVIACIISIMLGLFISMFSGHVLTAPGVSIFIIIAIIMLYNKVNIREDKI